MATTHLPLHLLILISIFLPATAGSPTTSPLHSPLPPPPFPEQAYPSSLFGPILSSLGFHGFSAAAPSLSNVTTWRGPTTIFAPSDSSLFTCSSCSIPLLLREHAVPGLFPLDYMRTLAFGTKIETLAPGRCITFTFSNASDHSEVYVSGVKITRPDMYNDGLVAVHGLQGFISHLSPYSCDVNRMTSLSFPHHPTTPFFLMRLMLKDAVVRLSTSGYGVVALALRVKYAELVNLQAMTVFALNDEAIFSGDGYAYVTNFRFHVVPNKLLMETDLESLRTGTVLPTVAPGEKLVVTTAVTGGAKVPVSINYVKISSPDLLYNLKIVVHGLSRPFSHIHPTAAGDFGEFNGRNGWAAAGSKAVGKSIREIVAPPPVIQSMVEIHDHDGL